VGLPALLSFLELEQKTGILRVAGGSVALKSGRPVHARTSELDSVTHGVEALHALLDVTRGTFEFAPDAVSIEDTICGSLTMILMDHARRADEAAAGINA